MTNREMMEIAMRQSAEDMGCCENDFKVNKNVIVTLKLGKNARKYLKEPITCNLVSYGNNIMVASINETLDIVSEYVEKFEFYHCFETPNMHWLNERLIERGHKICFMAEYYLPDINRIPILSCAYKTRILKQEDFGELYRPEWSNALCEDRKQLDILGDRRIRWKYAGWIGRLFRRLQRYVADWCGCTARIQTAGDCFCTDKRTRKRNHKQE